MRDTSSYLWTLFRDTLALGASAPALLACGDEIGPGLGLELDPGFVEVTCVAMQPAFLAGVEPAQPVDYLALADVHDDGNLQIVEEVGTACLDAPDPPTCLAALAAPIASSELLIGERGQFFFYDTLLGTRGGEVVRVRSADSLRELLGPIDTAAYAVLRAASTGFSATCSRSGSKPATDGFQVQLFSHFGCGGRRRHLLFVSTSGDIAELEVTTERDADPNCIVGRRPAGLARRRTPASPSVGEHFARAAELEAASVPAFRVFERELAIHGAPHQLCTRARRAAADEVRHAGAVARLARRYGKAPFAPHMHSPGGPRSLETLALENAVEGCVRETYGALVALHQAERASDRAVRDTYTRIALDETRHAALAWDVARWLRTRDAGLLCRRAASAGRHAVDSLRASARQEPPRELVDVAGVPPARAALAMLEQLDRALWRGAFDAATGIRGDAPHRAKHPTSAAVATLA